jgi:glycosyltransferase involved in cell wall biosynthesis
MKIDFVTTQPAAACSSFYSEALKRLPEVTLYDPDITDYDVVLVMTYDHHLVPKIKEINPRAKVGIIDPRSHLVMESAKACDFLVIDSVEMEDYWAAAKKPILRYVEYPDIRLLKKEHYQRDVVRIGYHGNQIHLDCMQDSVTPALSNLSQHHSIELVVMYNGSPPRSEEPWLPKGVRVKHVQWSMSNYEDELSKCDIGLVPNNLIHDASSKSMASLTRKYNYSQDDYSLRFKMPSNPGRFVVFGRLGIPVVADFYPSALQYLREDLKTGMVACNPSGWERCLERLITSHELRQEMGDRLQSLVVSEFDFEHQNKRLLNFLKTL